MNLNEIAKEIHENAKTHGWWTENRSFGEIIALCHSELSESLEEYRKGCKPNIIYGSCPECGLEQSEINESCDNCYKALKPEGIPIELADCIIRILDYCSKENLKADNYMTLSTHLRPKTNNFGDWISYFHATLSACLTDETSLYLGGCIKEIHYYCQKEGIDIEKAIRIKHEYNKTRPYRHGGKII